MWTSFLERHPHPHLVVGWTRSVVRWRDDAFLQLIAAQQPVGRYLFKRDFDEGRSRYLVLVAFEKETDANKLADFLEAETIAYYSGYASQRGFALRADLMKKVRAALKRSNAGRRVPTKVAALPSANVQQQ